jgi:cell pole-organizing protein PopZ
MSNQANPNQQSEPTMEEILASIRKIISEDQSADGAKPIATRLAAARPQPVAEPAVTAPELDVLDLTEEVRDDEPATAVTAAPTPPASPSPAQVFNTDVIFQSIEPANGRAHLNGQGPKVSIAGGSLEAIFAEAVQQAFRPALKEWIGDHSNELTDQLRPVIRAWMDEHLPPLIEAAVVKEIARAFQRMREP